MLSYWSDFGHSGHSCLDLSLSLLERSSRKNEKLAKNEDEKEKEGWMGGGKVRSVGPMLKN